MRVSVPEKLQHLLFELFRIRTDLAADPESPGLVAAWGLPGGSGYHPPGPALWGSAVPATLWLRMRGQPPPLSK